jgi:hypothetical protein
MQGFLHIDITRLMQSLSNIQTSLFGFRNPKSPQRKLLADQRVVPKVNKHSGMRSTHFPGTNATIGGEQPNAGESEPDDTAEQSGHLNP